MQLHPGQRLGPYEIVGPLGAGGMGEVYRARDTRLDRAVAIKILPDDAARDASHRARFAREAKAISALAHPNICTLFDLGSADGVEFLVMELLEGETLTERLRKGPLSLDALLAYGIAIADALEKAHTHGIIHRDLKPGNLMVTKSGVKLLDFGLAELRPSRSNDSEAATSRLDGERLTKRGMIVGTLDFMAPEQLDGRGADERTDIFALGNVLYRMATGRPPFEGTSEAAMAGAILNDDPPPVRERRPDLPPSLERLILDCLRKDPAERMQSAHDVKLTLQAIAAGSSEPPARRSQRRSLLPWIAGLVAVAAAVMATLLVRDRTERTQRQTAKRFTIELPDLPPAYDWASREFAIAPDGGVVVITLIGDGQWRLYARRFDSLELTPLAGTERGFNPFFSPDGQWIGFSADGKLKKVRLDGGPPITIADAPRVRGASWGADGSIVYAPVSSGEGLYEISANGGTPKPVTKLDPSRKNLSHRWPHFLPDPRYVLFAIEDWGGDYDRKKVAILDRQTGQTKVLVQGGTDPRYIDGYLLFAKERSLHAVRFDPATMSVSGLAIPVLENVVTHAGVGSVSAEIGGDGTLVYVPYDPVIDERTLMWVDRQGHAEELTPLRRPYHSPRLSPDGRQLIAGAGEARATDLWLFDIAGNSWSRIAEKGKSLAPVWSPDASQIYFSSNRDGPYNIFVMRSDGTGGAKRITDSVHWPFARAVTPDGKVLIAEEQDPVTSYDIWQVQTDGSGRRAILAGPANENHPDLSPDGRWMVYHSTESGRSEVYVQQFPPSGRKWMVSDGGGIRPRWSPRGDEIFYWSDQRLMSARVTANRAISIARPQPLFRGDYASDYDVASDGQHFVTLRASARAREGRLAVVLNWPAELRARIQAAAP